MTTKKKLKETTWTLAEIREALRAYNIRIDGVEMRLEETGFIKLVERELRRIAKARVK